MDQETTIAHECGHAIGLLLLGHGVAEVRVDHEQLGEFGRVTADFSHSSADYDYAIACLMGPLNAGQAPPAWPPHRGSTSTDEHVLGVLVDHLDLSEGDYRVAIHCASTFLDWHVVKGACALLGQALHRVPVIDGDQLKELLGPRLAQLQANLPKKEEPCNT